MAPRRARRRAASRRDESLRLSPAARCPSRESATTPSSPACWTCGGGRFGEQSSAPRPSAAPMALADCGAVDARLAARRSSLAIRRARSSALPGAPEPRRAISTGALAWRGRYMSGEASRPPYHLARESGVAYVGAGHHATERYGMRALGEHLARGSGSSTASSTSTTRFETPGPAARTRRNHLNPEPFSAKALYFPHGNWVKSLFVQSFDQEPEHVRRRRRTRQAAFLMSATTVAAAWPRAPLPCPFLGSWFPSARALAAGAPVEVDIIQARAGRADHRRVAGQAGLDPAPHARRCSRSWRRTTRWCADPKSRTRRAARLRANGAALHQARGVRGGGRLYPPRLLAARSRRKSAPAATWARTGRAAYYCPCHGSRFDLAGRVFKGAPGAHQPRDPAHIVRRATPGSSSAKTAREREHGRP